MAELKCRIDPASTKYGKGRVWKWTLLKGTKKIASGKVIGAQSKATAACRAAEMRYLEKRK
jgi:hypothetical protein